MVPGSRSKLRVQARGPLSQGRGSQARGPLSQSRGARARGFLSQGVRWLANGYPKVYCDIPNVGFVRLATHATAFDLDKLPFFEPRSCCKDSPHWNCRYTLQDSQFNTSPSQGMLN